MQENAGREQHEYSAFEADWISFDGWARPRGSQILAKAPRDIAFFTNAYDFDI
jgi:hypothetical protein